MRRGEERRGEERENSNLIHAVLGERDSVEPVQVLRLSVDHGPLRLVARSLNVVAEHPSLVLPVRRVASEWVVELPACGVSYVSLPRSCISNKHPVR